MVLEREVYLKHRRQRFVFVLVRKGTNEYE